MSNKYQDITDLVIAKLHEGVVPWRKPFTGESMAPRNFVSKRRYSGSNIILLGMAGYDAPYWLTYKQAQGLGGNIRKGERATNVTFFNFHEVKESDGTTKKIPLLGTKAVFNIEQTEGIEWALPKPKNDLNPIEGAEGIVSGYQNPPTVRHNAEGSACYIPSLDTISVPQMGDFDSAEDYYSTMFHEMGHSTGHESRLARDIKNHFGDEKYSREELVAEMTAMFLCSECGIEGTHNNSTAYINSWIKSLQNDPKMVIWAAGRAQKAADHIRNIEKDEVA